MGKKLVELTAEIVKEQVAATPMSVEQTEAFITRIFNTLKTIQEAEQDGGLLRALSEATERGQNDSGDDYGKVNPINARKSIGKSKVTCLECGLQFRQITANHLRTHGLTAREYKRKWGFRLKDSLAAKDLTAMRSDAARKRGIPDNLRAYIDAKQEARRG